MLGLGEKNMKSAISTIILIALFLIGCEKDNNNIVVEPIPAEYEKVVLLIEKGLISKDYSLGWHLISMVGARATLESLNPDPSIYFALSETSPDDTFTVFSNGEINKVIDSSGIPIADYFYEIKAHLQKNDTANTVVTLYDDIWSFSLIDSIIIESYSLTSTNDTIFIENPDFLFWKPTYKIDTLKFQVYVKESRDLTYDRFALRSTDFLYKNVSYDSINRIINFEIGLDSLDEEPIIVYYPFSEIDFIFENSFIKIISRFFYQEEKIISASMIN